MAAEAIGKGSRWTAEHLDTSFQSAYESIDGAFDDAADMLHRDGRDNKGGRYRPTLAAIVCCILLLVILGIAAAISGHADDVRASMRSQSAEVLMPIDSSGDFSGNTAANIAGGGIVVPVSEGALYYDVDDSGIFMLDNYSSASSKVSSVSGRYLNKGDSCIYYLAPAEGASVNDGLTRIVRLATDTVGEREIGRAHV